MVNQLDKLIEVVSTMQLVAWEGTVIYTLVVLLCTFMECIYLLDDMNQLEVESELYFNVVDLFQKENNKMTFMAFKRFDVRLKWLQQMYAMEHPLE